MEEEMLEDASNGEEVVEYTFTAYEVDLDYEFDAARFFDFSKDESPLDARRAELWFDSAGSYPPSPFVARLVPRDEMLIENINISPKSKGVESMNLSESDSDVEADHGISARGMISCGGLTFYNQMDNNVKPEKQTKPSMKPSFPRTSTLMKPTASQLAKQNRPFQTGYSRSHMPVLDKTSKSSASTCVIENQAAKRQKLEGGLLRKVEGTATLQQTNFVHKVPKQEGDLDGNIIHTKLRITVPRDPDLETARRAQRIREKGVKDEKVTSTVRRFKALPLRRKILEAPSLLPKRSTPRVPDFQEFHLKTSERAIQNSSTFSKSTVPCNYSDKELHICTNNLTSDCGNREPARPSLKGNASRPDGFQPSHSFKALPLNKKILTSKGDIGIYRNIKKETTVPLEFHFKTDKRFNPPVDLFNKLSLASATPPLATNFESKVPWSTSISAKGSKENRWGCVQQGNEINQPAKFKLPLFGGKQQFSADKQQNNVNAASSVGWNNSVR